MDNIYIAVVSQNYAADVPHMERSQEQIIVHQELPEHIQHQAHISL